MIPVLFGGKWIDTSQSVLKSVRRAGLVALRRLGFMVRATAMKSIDPKKGASEPGTPPHTHSVRIIRKKGKNRGRKWKGNLPESIIYAIQRHPDAVIVGPSVRIMGEAAKPHEHGGEFRGNEYPERPFMRPALSEHIGELPGLISEQLAKTNV